MKSRVAYFDQMKAVAIILVVIGHLTQFCFGMQGTDVNRWLEIFQMPVFFFVSGYFAYKALPTCRDVLIQLWKRVHTIGIPLLVWCLVWTLTHDGETWLQMLSRCGGKYWFLYTLTILSVFFILYEQLAKKIKNPWLYTAIWCVPFIALMAAKIEMGGVNTWIPIDSLVNYYRFYLIGMFCRKYTSLNDVLFHNSVNYAVAFIAFALQFVFADKCNYVLAFLGAMGGIVLLQEFFASMSDTVNKESWLLNRLNFIGTKTLSIYLIHYFFIPDMKQFELLVGIGNPFIVHLTICLFLAIIIIVASLVVERVIDKNKYLAWLLLGKS